MKIGFDISQTGKDKAGCGYFALSLIRALAEIDHENEYLLYTSFGDTYWDPALTFASSGIRQSNFSLGLHFRDGAEMHRFWQNPPSDFEARLGNPDVIIANNFYCPTRLRNAHLIYTLYDLNFLDHPEWTTEENRLICFQGVFRASQFADQIIAISKFSKEYFTHIFPHFPAEKIHVIYPASRFALNKTPTERPELLADILPERYWLSVGTLEPRKNYVRLLDAYAQLTTRTEDPMPLVHAGGSGWLMDNFRDHLKTRDLGAHLKFLGYVDDRTLYWLYKNCYAFVYPSLFEGFGLPVLEAMSLGAPVLTSNVTSIPEIVGDAGLLIDPENIPEIVEGMDRLQCDTNLRNGLKAKSIEQAGHFSWRSAAMGLLNLLK